MYFSPLLAGESWGLRAYASVDGEQEQVWPAAGREAEAEGCEHEWQDESYRNSRLNDDTAGEKQCTNTGATGWRNETRWYATCEKCGATRCALGLEKSPEEFVSHLVSIFRELRRVLHPTGCAMVNIGDSFASKWSAGTRRNVVGSSWTPPGDRDRLPAGLKETDLVGVPFLLAQALRADGWYLRCVLPWIKPSSAMPESVRSRPSVSHEYWLMLTKSKGYYWDPESVRVGLRQSSVERNKTPRVFAFEGHGRLKGGGIPNTMNDGHDCKSNESGRNFRTGDEFLLSLDCLIAEQSAWLDHLRDVRKRGGLLLDEDGDPLALLVNPRGFSGAKYLGDWSREEWRPVDPTNETKGKRKQEVWYIAAPDCASHAHYHRADKYARLGYADGREVERRAGDVDGAACACLEVLVDHFASFSEQLVTPLVRACCPELVCEKCHAPKVREVKRGEARIESGRTQIGLGRTTEIPLTTHGHGASTLHKLVDRETLGWSPSCGCEGAGFVPGTVLDPFVGSGTTLTVAKTLGLRGIGIDTSADYLVMAASRLAETGLTGEKGKQQAAAARAGQGSLAL